MVIAMNEQERAEYVRTVLATARETLKRTATTGDEQHAQPVVKQKDIQAGRLHYRRSETRTIQTVQQVRDQTWDDDWNNWCDNRIRSIVQQHQSALVEGMGEVISIERKRTREVVKNAIDDVDKQISECRTQMAEFRG